MTDKWEDYRTFVIDQQNQTGQVAVVKSSFANELFEQCSCINDNKKYSCVRSDNYTTSNIEEFVKDRVIETENLPNLLLVLIAPLLVFYLIEICIGTVPLLQFLLGPRLHVSTERQEEPCEIEGQNSQRKNKSFDKRQFQITCVLVVLIFVIVTILPFVLPWDKLPFKLHVWKDSECPSEYFDLNYNLNSGNHSNFLKCEGKS